MINTKRCVLASLAGVLSLSVPAMAQDVRLDQLEHYPSEPPRRQAAPARPATAWASPKGGSERLQEGTEVRVRIEDQLSSATSSVGDSFSITTDEDIVFPDGVVIPAGYRGRGEVVEAHKKEMLGKGGELAIRLDYVRIGAVRVHLRANRSGEGKSTLTTALVLSFLLTPLFLMHHGGEVVFPKGQDIRAYVDDDADIPLPVPPPPRFD